MRMKKSHAIAFQPFPIRSPLTANYKPQKGKERNWDWKDKGKGKGKRAKKEAAYTYRA